MDKETIFKEIRRQQVLLWAGAGFSRYAGYPMGKGVVERLYQELSTSQKQQLAATLGQKEAECPSLMPLPDFAQYFVNLHYDNRQRLTEILDTIFSANPTTRSVHNKLASIAFIDKIVTTNYDLLFELAYGYQNLHIVTQATNVPQGSSKDVTLYKIHGELRDPNSLIITKDDYYGFFQKADDVVWTQLRALMAVRTIVFIGYAVEDPNILDVFLDTLSKLGKLMRPAYVVGPDMPQLRVEELRRKNIYFIQATGEEFVNDLLEDIKQNALTDLKEKGAALVKPVSKTLSNLGLNCSMSIDGTSYLVNDIKNKQGKTKEGIRFSSVTPEKRIEISNLIKGQSLAPVKIKLDGSNKFNRIVEGFIIPEGQASEVWLMRAPEWRGTVDIKFATGYYVKDVYLSVFRKVGAIHIVALASFARLECICLTTSQKGFTELDLEYSRRKPYFSDLAEITEYAKLMRELGDSGPFEVIQGGKAIWKSEENGKRSISKRNEFARESDALKKLLDALSVIEQRLSISFRKFALEGQLLNDIALLYSLLTQTPMQASLKAPIEIPVNEENAEVITSCLRNKEELIINASNEEEFEILGWKIKANWEESVTIEKPNIKKKQALYLVKSADKKISRNCTSLLTTAIVSSPIWPVDVILTEQDQFDEQQPRLIR